MTGLLHSSGQPLQFIVITMGGGETEGYVLGGEIQRSWRVRKANSFLSDVQ